MIKRDRLLYQYKNASGFKKLLDELYTITASCSPEDLLRFLDIDNASGDWLTQLADIFNVSRYYTSVGTTFILDFSALDSGSEIDGGLSPIDDTILRALLKARILRNTTKIKSIEYMLNIWRTVINPDDIEIVEGVKSLVFNLTFTSGSIPYYLYIALTSIDNKWFGVPATVDVTFNETII